MKCLLFIAFIVSCTVVKAAVPIQHWQTESGVRIYFVEAHNLPMLDVRVAFAAGSVFDPDGKMGVASLTAGLLEMGAGDMDESAVAERLADVGARLSSSAGLDQASVSLRTLSASKYRQPALSVLQQVLQAPRFEEDVVKRERDRSIAGLKDALTRPRTLASRAFWRALYPQHPYGRQNSVEALSSISRDDLLNFYKQHYYAANAVVTMVGDITRGEAETIVYQLTGNLPTEPSGKATSKLPDPPGDASVEEVLIEHPAKQAHILLGLPTIAKGSPDYYALLVGNYVFGGGGFVSRLMKEVREKRGLVYSIYSYFSTLRQAGPFRIGLQTRKSQAQQALSIVRAELNKFIAHGPSANELKTAKANIVGSFPLGLDSNAKLLRNVATIGFYGLPLNYLDTFQAEVQAVSAEQVRQAFARYVKPQAMATVIVGAEKPQKTQQQ